MIQKVLLTNSITRPFLRDNGVNYLLKDVRGIVIHYTANVSRGAGARSHIKYFNHTKTPHSAHYFVDSKEILQAIPNHEMAFHVGDKNRTDHVTPHRDTVLRGKEGNPNDYLIGIEMCVNADGDWAETVQKTIYLVRYLMAEYFLDVSQVYRHYDITCKEGPKMFLPQRFGGLDFDWNWDLFKSLIDLEPLIVEVEVVKEVEKPLKKYIVSELVAAIFSKINIPTPFR